MRRSSAYHRPHGTRRPHSRRASRRFFRPQLWTRIRSSLRPDWRMANLSRPTAAIVGYWNRDHHLLVGCSETSAARGAQPSMDSARCFAREASQPSCVRPVVLWCIRPDRYGGEACRQRPAATEARYDRGFILDSAQPSRSSTRIHDQPILGTRSHVDA
jgi:hypothetical protein